ncbi:iron complex transport system substrate-binding protein [Gelidibacter algens]|uniref:Iron complex transport system substrate-binding protein n=1 Tax=Gelidibacter algens TaxID=49280 RepID=A0A1A7QYH0_9FLAO|nr:ABC transporter substrate-binding protein [Gelidibacter algens]OBX24606.1 ABC transporter substrate-binding protein [Gelidibacter algens]RAJ27787.1 iron complex transport system substrate-binding protein [Gelidibacter algens]
MKKLSLLVLFLVLLTCKEDKRSNAPLPSTPTENVSISYAEGFSIQDYQDFKVLEIKNPWPKSEQTFRYALISKEMAPKITLNKDDFDAILITPIEKIVVTSTTHIPGLELLNVQNTLVGFPDTDYVSSEKTRALIDKGLVRELGKNESINTEVLLELRPELVIGFGIDGNNKTFENIQKAGIPVIYNGDWVEKSPLAKAEWIKFFGVLYNKEKEADTIFNTIETDYLEAKKLASEVTSRPTVLSGAMHKDIWYLPNGTSPEAQLLKDANVDYLWSDTTGSGSLALNFETVLDKAKDADIWINPSYYSSLEAIEKANTHYTKFKAFETKNVYSFVNKAGATGGVLYYELGMARPDLVLKDLIKICHPELIKDYDTFFFERLE